MRRHFGLFAGVMIIALAVVGCGSKETEEETTEEVTEEESTEESSSNLVSMQENTEDDKDSITNIMGSATAGADLIIINNTGLEIAEFYCRVNGEDDWGDDYIQGDFTLQNGDKALFYYDPDATDEDGVTITAYDLRICYTDEDETACIFRNLTLSDIEELTLNMEDGVPFVTYTSLSTKKSVSTLEDAKARMGRTEEDSDSDESDDTETTVTPTETPTPAAESDSDSDSSNVTYEDPDVDADGDTSSTTADGETAGSYVGQSMDSLENTVGSANSSEYDTDPETGATIGYYYYDGYTVSTVEQDGEEIVTGVW